MTLIELTFSSVYIWILCLILLAFAKYGEIHIALASFMAAGLCYTTIFLSYSAYKKIKQKIKPTEESTSSTSSSSGSSS